MVKLYTVLQFEDDSRVCIETTRFVESYSDDDTPKAYIYRTAIGAEDGTFDQKLNPFKWAEDETEAIENHKVAIGLLSGCDGCGSDDCDDCCGCGGDEEEDFEDELDILCRMDEEVVSKDELIDEYEKVAPKCETANPEVSEEKEEPKKTAKTVDDIIALLSKTGVKNMDFKTNSTMINGVYTNTIYGVIDGDEFESTMKWNHEKDESSIVMKINGETALEMNGSIDELREDIFKVAKALLESR